MFLPRRLLACGAICVSTGEALRALKNRPHWSATHLAGDQATAALADGHDVDLGLEHMAISLSEDIEAAAGRNRDERPSSKSLDANRTLASCTKPSRVCPVGLRMLSGKSIVMSLLVPSSHRKLSRRA